MGHGRFRLLSRNRLFITTLVLYGLGTGSTTAYQGAGLTSDQASPSIGSSQPALAAEKSSFERIRDAHPGLRTLESIDRRIAVIEDGRGLAVAKLNEIADSAASDHPTMFLYVAPKPEEVLSKLREEAARVIPSYEGLTSEESVIARLYLDSRLQACDKAVIGAYLRVVGSPVTETAKARARTYLTAYILGTHDAGDCASVLPLLQEAITGKEVPAFLVDDALTALGDIPGAANVVEALEAAPQVQTSQVELTRLWTAVAGAADGRGDRERAVLAYRRIIEKGAEADAQAAQRALIAFYADKAKEYDSAARACAEYLKRFADSEDAVNVEYMKALYEWQADRLDDALGDVKAFREKHGEIGLTPSVMVLEGLIYNAQNKTVEAVESFPM